MTQNDRARRLALSAGALGIAADERACSLLLAHLDALLEMNRRLNLTAVRDPAAAAVLHVLDSLAVELAAEGAAPWRRALDLGSGNGFPGVAVAALHPETEVGLMERTAKKARALESLLAGSGLRNARVLHLDAGQAPALRAELRASFDLVTARAVATPAAVARLAAPLTAPGGHLVLWLDEHRPAALGGERAFALVREIPYELPPPASRRRRLAVCRRV